MRFLRAAAIVAALLTVSASGAVLAQGIGTAGYEIKYGAEYMAAKQYDTAAMRFRQAVQLDPDNAEAWFLLGKAYLHLKRTNDANEALSRAYALDPSLKARAGELPRAAPATPVAADGWTGLDVGPVGPPPIGTAARETYYGKQYLAKREYALAAMRFRQALDLDPDYAEAQFWLAGAYRRQGQTAQAKQALAKALQLNPSLQAHQGELGRFNPPPPAPAAKPTPKTSTTATSSSKKKTGSSSCDDLFAACYAGATRCSFYNPNPNSSSVYTGCTPDFARQSQCQAERNACYARNGKK